MSPLLPALPDNVLIPSLEALEAEAQDRLPTTSIFATGGPGVGKTKTLLDFLLRQEGGILLFDGGSGSEAFRRRYYPQLSKGPAPFRFRTMQDLVVTFYALVETKPRMLEDHRNILIDDATLAWHWEKERKEAARRQRDAGPAAEREPRDVDWWSRFQTVAEVLRNDFQCILTMTTRGTNTFTQVNGRWVPTQVMRGDMTEEMLFPFDLAYSQRICEESDAKRYDNGDWEREAVILKSRFPGDFPEGSVKRAFLPDDLCVILEDVKEGEVRRPLSDLGDQRTALAARLSRSRMGVSGVGAGDEGSLPGREGASSDSSARRTRSRDVRGTASPSSESSAGTRRAEDLLERLRKLGTTAKGGLVPKDKARDMLQVLGMASPQGKDLDEIERVLTSYERISDDDEDLPF